MTSTTAPGSGAHGTYNLSGGTLTGASSGSRGMIVGTNNGTTATFNPTGSGKLVMDSSIVMVGGRTDTPISGVSGTFNQSSGSADIGTLAVAVGTGTGESGILNLTRGVFVPPPFHRSQPRLPVAPRSRSAAPLSRPCPPSPPPTVRDQPPPSISTADHSPPPPPTSPTSADSPAPS